MFHRLTRILAFKFFTQFTMYTFCYCGVVLGAAGSTLQKSSGAGEAVDPHLIAILAIAGFFGLFTFMMTVASWRYIATNMTNVDMLGAKNKVYQLAVRVPRGTMTNDKYQTVTYPLERPGVTPNVYVNGGALNGYTPSLAQTGRDALAKRTFAVLKTEAGENPWDLGTWMNWQEVMGPHVIDWFFPIRKSPCVDHNSHESYYRMDRMLQKLRTTYGIDGTSVDETDRMELRELQHNNTN